MTDKELHEFAAKAVGKRLAGWWWDGVGFATHKGLHDDEHIYWRPRADDGDAMRLAVAIGLRLTPGKHKGDGASAEPIRHSTAGCTAFRNDECEQMRVAILTAAAEIGKARAAASIGAKGDAS